MRLLLLLTFSVVSACGNDKKEPSPQVSQEVTKAKAGPVDGLSDSVISNYLRLNEVLVTWDSSEVNPLANQLIVSIDSLKQSLSKDSVQANLLLQNAGNEIRNLVKASGLENKRKAYHRSNSAFFEFLRSTNYSGPALYLQQCPMAFDDTAQGLWISRSAEIRNPYLGLYHPRYGKGMLECGHNKEVLNGTLEEEE